MNKSQPKMYSITGVNSELLHSYISTAIMHHINKMANYNFSYDVACGKTLFYFTGLTPFTEIEVRNIVEKIRSQIPGYSIRLTKRAGFDAMLTVTISRKIMKNYKYFW